MLKLKNKNNYETKVTTIDGYSGIWSVDIMKTDNDYYLIDMAIGWQSAYYDYDKIRRLEQ